MEETRRLTRKEKRRALRQNRDNTSESLQEKLNFVIKEIKPLTTNQQSAFSAYEQGRNLLLHGVPGTGKSFLGVYFAINEILSNPDCAYKKLIIVRSAVSVRDIGFLPGSPKEKMKEYEAAYIDIFGEIFGRGDAYNYMKQKGIVEFVPTSFIRGLTFRNAIILVDEIANMSYHELDSIITRCGYNTKIMFAGDFRQSDFTRSHERVGLHDFMNVIKKMKSFSFIDFNEKDIVRSGLVKEYIITKIRYEDTENKLLL